jgi:hypothetical protein
VGASCTVSVQFAPTAGAAGSGSATPIGGTIYATGVAYEANPYTSATPQAVTLGQLPVNGLASHAIGQGGISLSGSSLRQPAMVGALTIRR